MAKTESEIRKLKWVVRALVIAVLSVFIAGSVAAFWFRSAVVYPWVCAESGSSFVRGVSGSGSWYRLNDSCFYADGSVLSVRDQSGLVGAVGVVLAGYPLMFFLGVSGLLIVGRIADRFDRQLIS